MLFIIMFHSQYYEGIISFEAGVTRSYILSEKTESNLVGEYFSTKIDEIMPELRMYRA